MVSSRSSTRVVTKCRTSIKTIRKETITWEINTKINITSTVSSKIRTNTTTITIDMGKWTIIQAVQSPQASQTRTTSAVTKAMTTSNTPSTCRMDTNGTISTIWWTKSTIDDSARITRTFHNHRCITQAISMKKILTLSMIQWTNRWEDTVAIWGTKGTITTIRGVITDMMITTTWMDTVWMVIGTISNMTLTETKRTFKRSVWTINTKNLNLNVAPISSLLCGWN